MSGKIKVFSRCDYCHETTAPISDNLDIPEGWIPIQLHLPALPKPLTIALCPNCKDRTREEAIVCVLNRVFERAANIDRDLRLLRQYMARIVFNSGNYYSDLGKVESLIDRLRREDDSNKKE